MPVVRADGQADRLVGGAVGVVAGRDGVGLLGVTRNLDVAGVLQVKVMVPVGLKPPEKVAVSDTVTLPAVAVDGVAWS